MSILLDKKSQRIFVNVANPIARATWNGFNPTTGKSLGMVYTSVPPTWKY